MEYAKHELDYINKYKEKGYTADFRLVESRLVELETKSKYNPKQVFIIREHRFEGMSNPSDLSIMYVIKTHDDKKGVVIVPYGPMAASELTDFFMNIPKENDLTSIE